MSEVTNEIFEAWIHGLAAAGAEPLTFAYCNYRGETRERKVMPLGIRFDRTPHHPEPQWLLDATDLEKSGPVEAARRTFAFSGFRPSAQDRARIVREFLDEACPVDHDHQSGLWCQEMRFARWEAAAGSVAP